VCVRDAQGYLRVRPYFYRPSCVWVVIEEVVVGVPHARRASCWGGEGSWYNMSGAKPLTVGAMASYVYVCVCVCGGGCRLTSRAIAERNDRLDRLAREMAALARLSPSGIFHTDANVRTQSHQGESGAGPKCTSPQRLTGGDVGRAQGHVTAANDQWFLITGLRGTAAPSGSGSGSSELGPWADAWRTHVHPADRARVDAAWARVEADPDAALDEEFQFQRLDGKLVWLHCQCLPHRAPPPSVALAAATSLQQQQQQGKEPFWRRWVRGRRAAPTSVADDAGLPVRRTSSSSSYQASPAASATAVAATAVRDERNVPARTRGTGSGSGSGRHGVIAALSDVTPRKTLEWERLAAGRRAAAAEAARRREAETHRREQARFVDVICHEMRNPLNGTVCHPPRE
jgi:PAS domain-containing protein